LLFFVPTCVLLYLVAFQFKHQVGKLPSVVFHWCLIAAALALVAAVLYNLLHSVRFLVTAGSLVRTERRVVLFKSVETIHADTIAGIALETGKNSFTGTPRYLLVLRLKDKRTETITTSQSEARIRELQTAMTDLLKAGRQ
jgi:hypothetical protein